MGSHIFTVNYYASHIPADTLASSVARPSSSNDARLKPRAYKPISYHGYGCPFQRFPSKEVMKMRSSKKTITMVISVANLIFH